MRTTKRHPLFATVLVSLFGLVAAGCGSDVDTAPGSSQPSVAGDKVAKLPNGYPDGPLTIRLPATGSGLEALGRVFARAGMDSVSPTQVRVDPLPSGGSNDATASVLSEPNVDEGTLVTFITNVTVVGTALNRTPFPFTGLKGVSTVAKTPLVIAVKEDSPYQNWADFAMAAKSDATKVKVGLAGPAGSLHHVAAIQLGQALGAQGSFSLVPHKDAGESTLTLLGGGVDASIGTWSGFKSQAEAKKLRVIASMGATRGDLTDFPTLQESGVDLTVENQVWVVTSSKVSDDKVAWLSELLSTAFNVPATQDGLVKLGWIPFYADSAQTQKDMQALYTKTGSIAADLGLKK
jgi:tripartite-type tricarboxylate transporter receptor subunit TctC